MCIQTATQTQILSIGQLFDAETFDPLLEAIEAARPSGCQSIEYVDDNMKPGYQQFEFDVTFARSGEVDEDGYSPVWETERVCVKALNTMLIYTVVFLLIGNINALIED